MSEMRAEDILDVLKNSEPGEAAEKIANSMDLFNGLRHYMTDESARKNLQKKILESDEKEKYIEGLIDILPFSNKILWDIIKEENYKQTDLLDIVSRHTCLVRLITKLKSACVENDTSKEKSVIETHLIQLENEMEKKQEQLEELKKKNKELSDMIEKRKELEQEINQEQKKQEMYSDSEIERLEHELEDCVKKANSLEEKNKKRLDDLKKELGKYMNEDDTNGNKEFNNALKSFVNVVEKLPEDGTDD